jgi:hypothetical protein
MDLAVNDNFRLSEKRTSYTLAFLDARSSVAIHVSMLRKCRIDEVENKALSR